MFVGGGDVVITVGTGGAGVGVGDPPVFVGPEPFRGDCILLLVRSTCMDGRMVASFGTPPTGFLGTFWRNARSFFLSLDFNLPV